MIGDLVKDSLQRVEQLREQALDAIKAAQSTAELEAIRAERAVWERRVGLLRSDNLDPDMLDERARVLLNLAQPNELILQVSR